MPNVNKVILMGVLGRDPETKNFPNGGSITTFSVATTDHWRAQGSDRMAQSQHQRTFSRNCE